MSGAVLGPLILSAILACVDPTTPVSQDPTTTFSDVVPTTSIPTERPRAGDLAIGKLSIYQAVEDVLSENGEDPTSEEPPIIVGRDAQLRVSVDPMDGFDPRKITAVLTVSNDTDEV